MEPNDPYPSYLPPTSGPAAPHPDPSQPPHTGSGRKRRWAAWLAGGTATALVFAAAGFAAGRVTSPSPSAASPATPNQTYGGRGFGGEGRTNPYGQQGESGGSGGYGNGFGSYGGSTGTTSTEGNTAASGSQLTGLVRIVTTLGYEDGKAAGTGMILSSDGEVVTNHHVVEGATRIQVTVMSTGKTYTASVVGSDAKADVALLQLKGASGLSTVKTDSDTLSVGDKVTAVGDAQGASTFSAAAGSVIGLNKSITTQSEVSVAGEKLTGMIEISSDVISGDSGGATYDSQGEVTGMTTAASQGGDVVGYAIPVKKVLSIVDDLQEGVTGSDYTYGYPAFLGVGLGQTGTTVQEVYDDTPAARAGMTAGDTITAVDGKSVSTSRALRAAIADEKAGDKVSVTWKTANGAVHRATVTLIQGPVS